MKKLINSKFMLLIILNLVFINSCEKDKKPGLPTDGDGNVYDTVVIGTQVWLTENLKTTKFNNGDAVRLITDDTEWSEYIRPAYCWYDNDPGYKDIYGALYNWYAGHNDLLCPVGYHVPTIEDWTTLADYLIDAPETARESFKIIQTGERYSQGYFSDGPYAINWWCSSPPNSDKYGPRANAGFQIGYLPKKLGYSVRCIKDN